MRVISCNIPRLAVALLLVLSVSSGCGMRSDLSPIEGMDAGTETESGGAAGSSSGPVELCGNGQIDEGEQCDGEELEGASCSSLGEGRGELSCGPSCFYDVSLCIPTGPGDVIYGTGSAARPGGPVL